MNTPVILDPVIRRDAIEWLQDCSSNDVDDTDEIATMTDAQLKRAISKHYEGGFQAFCHSTCDYLDALENEAPF